MILLAYATVALLDGSRPAAAQVVFVDALAELTVALSGLYGDEGTHAWAALDRLERALTEWDQTLREYEANVAEIRPTASPGRVLDMHVTMSRQYVRRGRFDDAVRELEAAAALATDEPLFHLFRGLAHEAAARPAEALQAYRRAWEIDPRDPVVGYVLAEAGARRGAAPPADVLAVLTDTVDRIAAGELFVEPAPFFETSLIPDHASSVPQFVPWLYTGAYAHVARGEYEAAVTAMRDAASRDPLLATTGTAVMSQGAQALRAGRVAEAIDHFAAAVRDAPGSEAHRMLGMAYWLAAEYERSIEHLDEAIRLNPADERSRLMLARVLDQIGETARAEQLLVETADALPSSALARWRLGRLFVSANRVEDALREYEAAARIGAFTGAAELYLAMGALYRRGVDAARAEAAFAEAVARRPNDAVAHRQRGLALLELERTDAAFVELAAAVLVDRTDHESWLTIGHMHLDASRHEPAARALAYAIGREPEQAEAHYGLAMALVQAGRRDEAAAHFETFERLQAAALDEQRRQISLSTLRLEADALTEAGELDRAVEVWTQLLAEEPEAAANHAGLAAALAGLGQLELATKHYEQATALGGGPIVYQRLAALYDTMGRPDASARTRARLARAQQDPSGGARR
jgi:tetratricopeptide (TPR) repeat protein